MRVYVEAKAFAAEQLRKTESATRSARAEPFDALAALSLVTQARTWIAWYGDVVMAMENGKLAIRFTRTPSLVGDLEHWQHDTFVARWRDRELRADAFVTFALNPTGRSITSKMRPISPPWTSASTSRICC